MPKFVSAYPGKLILPDGETIEAGGDADLDAATVKNVAVAEWIKAGWLNAVPTKKADKAE